MEKFDKMFSIKMKIKFQLNELERPIIPLLLQLKGNRHFTLNNPPPIFQAVVWEVVERVLKQQ